MLKKEGKFHFLKSTFEGFETFLFVPNTVTKSGRISGMGWT